MMATEIWTIEDLDNVRLDLSGDYLLMRDLDFNDDNSYANPANKPIFTTGDGWIAYSLSAGAPWQGKFNGDGHTISNLYSNKVVLYSSFFGYCNPASEIKNVGFIDAWLSVYSYAGVVCGMNQGKITNVYATGYLKGRHQVGGLCGASWYNTAEITKCWTDMECHASTNHCGGLVGYHHKGSIDQCFTLGDVYGESSYIGSFVGENQSSPASITNCYARGDAHKTTASTHSTIGNFVGRNYTASIEDCYATGKVIYDVLTDPTDKGGVGNASGTQGGGENVWDMETSLQTTSGSPTIFSGKTTIEMKDYLTYKSIPINWDIAKTTNWVNEIWVIDDEKDYPELSWAWIPPSLGKSKVKSVYKNNNVLEGESKWL